ncbi:MAG: PfkB family carbohydrate kinase [Candidatus Limnocylindrales bacterium]
MYCSLAAARLGLRVGCLMGVDSLAAEAKELSLLEAAGVDLRRVRLGRGPVFENIEAGGHRRQRWLSKSDVVPVSALPDEWRGAAGWLLVPVAGEVGEEWAAEARSSAPGGARVGLGWQGMLREFAGDGWVRSMSPRRGAVLAAAGLVCASVDDLPRESTLEDLQRLAPDATVVLTAGVGGGFVMRGGKLRRYRALPAGNAPDPTGAGDVFLAALMVAWILTGELATAATLRFAAAAAACSVEGVGPAAIPTKIQVAARLRS